MSGIISEATTRYNSRKWQVIYKDEIIISFPPIPDGKRLAQLEALDINRPDLAILVHLAIENQGDDTRKFNVALKAAQIIEAELLYRNGTCHSQSRAGIFHTVTYDGQPKQYRCTCEAFTYCPVYIKDVGFLCKHCLADHWVYLLGIDLSQQPIPF